MADMEDGNTPHGRKVEIVSPAWGDVFSISMDKALIKVDGEDPDGTPMTADLPLYALFKFVHATMEFMIALNGIEGMDDVIPHMPPNLIHEFQMESLKATAVLIALGYGANPETTVGTMMTDLLSDDDEEPIMKFDSKKVDESIQELMRSLMEAQDDDDTETRL